MDSRAALWAERFLALTGLAWVVFALGVGVLAPLPVHLVAPLSERPVFAVMLALGTLASCSLPRRHLTTVPALRNIPSLAAAILLLLAVEAQVVAFHSRRPSPWEVAALASSACIVATVGGRCFTRAQRCLVQRSGRLNPSRMRKAAADRVTAE